jgi:hypothetical protein
LTDVVDGWRRGRDSLSTMRKDPICTIWIWVHVLCVIFVKFSRGEYGAFACGTEV